MEQLIVSVLDKTIIGVALTATIQADTGMQEWPCAISTKQKAMNGAERRQNGWCRKKKRLGRAEIGPDYSRREPGGKVDVGETCWRSNYPIKEPEIENRPKFT